MGNPLFAFPDRTLAATLSGGSWQAGLPLANLQNPLLSKVARSADAALASTLWDVDLGAVRAIRLLSIIRHNASANATARWTFFSDAGHTLPVHDTGWLPFWPAYWPVLAQEWEADEFWTGDLTAEDIASYDPRPDLWHCLAQPIHARYARVEVSDAANPDGYFELGRALIAPAVQAVQGVLVDPRAGWRSQTTVEQALGGVEYFNRRRAVRIVEGLFEHMSTGEGMAIFYDRQRRLDIAGEMYFVWDPDDTLLLYRQRSMLCRAEQLDPLENPYYDGARSPVRFKEII